MKKIQAYFDDLISEQPLTAQLQHFGTETAARMVKAELTSLIHNLYAKPIVVSVRAMPWRHIGNSNAADFASTGLAARS